MSHHMIYHNLDVDGTCKVVRLCKRDSAVLLRAPCTSANHIIYCHDHKIKNVKDETKISLLLNWTSGQ